MALRFGKLKEKSVKTWKTIQLNSFAKFDLFIFRDIFGVFQDVTALRALKDMIIDHVSSLDIDVVIGLDSRGFLLGPIISLELGKPFLPIRKKGKLPGKVIRESYTLEYGEVVLLFDFLLYFILF